MKTIVIICTALVYLSLGATAQAAKDSMPEVTVDGLHLVKGTKMAAVYAKPGTDLSVYNRIYLIEPHISFISNWLRTQNSIPNQHVSKDDMQLIKTELANLFTEVFKQELQNNGGYVLVEGVADDVLIVHPAIVDLNVLSPDTPRTRGKHSAIASVGSMTLYMELIDSVSGDMLVKAYDNKWDRTRTQTYAPNNLRNKTAAKELLAEWAELLRLALDEARTVVSKH